MLVDKIVDKKIVNFLNQGGVWTETRTPMPDLSKACGNWFNQSIWMQLEELTYDHELFSGFSHKFINNAAI